MPRLNWGAVIIGVLAGLGVGLLLFVLTGFARSTAGTTAVLIFVQYLTQFGAGFLAARIAVREPLLHGGAAGLLLFGIASFLTLALTTGRPAVWVLAFSGLVAVVLGSAGGSLAESLRTRGHPARPDGQEHDEVG